ncbi:MAG: hypothetical protein KDA05_12280 [Phycisphaerales bacterium]|nr:hypothetical protein [Phycisphaerales bacterium]MCB9840764.1 hypothetical protein [Phycisphaeraceae bacterium]
MTGTNSRNRRVVARVLAAAGVVAAALVLAACNTVKGAGQDLQEASQNTQNAIERAAN